MKNEILVMDCEERGMFWLTLRSDYRVLFATTGEEGLEMLSEKVSLVFLNMKLPDMKSMEVFRLIKEKYPSIAVIIITACDEKGAAEEVFRNSASDYAQRPLAAEDVVRKIKALVDTGAPSGQPRESTPVHQAEPVPAYPDIAPHIVAGVFRVKDFLAQNCSASLTLAAACRMASLSKTYFCHYFKEITGQSLRSYQHAVKVRMAGELLADRRLSVKEVSKKLGYRDPNYFSTVYRKVAGISPKQGRVRSRDVEHGHGEGKDGISI
jgi:YesN/AraC family two-component response regulator